MDDENTTFKERDIPETRTKPEDQQSQISFWSYFFAVELGKLRPGKEK